MMFHPAFHPHDATFGASPYDAFYSPQRPFVRSDYARAQREAALREADRRASVRAQHELAARQQELARRQAQAKQRKKLLRLAHAAATRIAAVYRGHLGRRCACEAITAREAAAARGVSSALTEIELAVGQVEREHAPTTEKEARVASELLMRQLLRLDELDMPAGAEGARAHRRALVRALNERIEQLDALADRLGAAAIPLPPSPPTTDDFADQSSACEAGGACAMDADVAMHDVAERPDGRALIASASAMPDGTPGAEQLGLAILRSAVADLERQNAELRALLAAARAESGR
ncbi:hypothetical protein KFE25_002033 [Diacronema lutheri]|uniref:BAG domain-containing protein n=2 Tax=Diacronema lutheri TaxID=2081491 RepID=A0A8J5XQ54_DIALT|nr:hypothetical protein KFE25_002033 [Diacronema lutheri]